MTFKKKFLIIIICLLAGIIIFFIMTSGNKDKSLKTKKHTAISDSKENASESFGQSTNETYICPLHPEVVRDRAGKCPKCGSDLILKDE